jgi:hypothetical protein
MRHWLAFAACVAVAAAAFACDGDGGSAESPTVAATATAAAPTATPTVAVAQPSPVDATGEIAVQVNAFVLALQSGDGDRIRGLAAQGIPLPEIDALVACVPQGTRLTIEERQITGANGTADVALTLGVTPEDAAPYRVEMTLTFVQAGDTWLLGTMPRCPL